MCLVMDEVVHVGRPAEQVVGRGPLDQPIGIKQTLTQVYLELLAGIHAPSITDSYRAREWDIHGLDGYFLERLDLAAPPPSTGGPPARVVKTFDPDGEKRPGNRLSTG